MPGSSSKVVPQDAQNVKKHEIFSFVIIWVILRKLSL